MGSELELLALRKDVLVARASLERLKIGRELLVLREGLQWPRAVSAIAASPPVRTALFGGLLMLVGRGRFARLVAAATAAVALAKVVVAFTNRAPEGQETDPGSY